MDFILIISKIYQKGKSFYRTLRSMLKYAWRFKQFGKGSSLGKYNRLIGAKYIMIGNDCYIANNLRMEAIANYGGGSFRPLIEIGNKVCINQNFHCTCAESIVIEDGVSITANCGVFDIIHPYEDLNQNPREALIRTKPIRIGENSLIGMNSVILPGTQLGKHCIVGANSTVSGVFPDYCVIAGSPAKIIKKYDFEQQKWIRV